MLILGISASVIHHQKSFLIIVIPQIYKIYITSFTIDLNSTIGTIHFFICISFLFIIINVPLIKFSKLLPFVRKILQFNLFNCNIFFYVFNIQKLFNKHFTYRLHFKISTVINILFITMSILFRTGFNSSSNLALSK